MEGGITCLFVLVESLVALGRGLPQDNLIRDLLSGYDRDAAPVINASDVVDVEVDVVVMSLQEIVERNQAVTLYLSIGSIWTDSRLSWDPPSHNNITEIAIHGDRIWTPDLVIRNSVTNMYGYLQNNEFRARISHNGKVHYWTGGSSTISCSLDMTFFPFDTHTCYVHVNCWSYTVSTIHLKAIRESIQRDMGSNSQWNILATNATAIVEVYNTENTFDSVIYRMVFQRKPAYYIRNIIFPCILLSILDLLMFLIPISVGDRISYGITVLLSFTVYQMTIADSLPRTSDQLPVIISYLMAVMVLTTACIIFSILIVNIHSQPDDKSFSPWFFFLTFNVLSRHRNQGPEDAVEHGSAGNNGLTRRSVSQTDILDWKAAAKVWDRLFFVISSLGLVVTSLVLLKLYPDIYNVDKGLNDYVIVS